MCEQCNNIQSRLDRYNSGLGSRIWSWIRGDEPVSSEDIVHLNSHIKGEQYGKQGQ